jgi:hypothetical protein
MPSGEAGRPEQGRTSDSATRSKGPVQANELIVRPATLARQFPGAAAGGTRNDGSTAVSAPGPGVPHVSSSSSPGPTSGPADAHRTPTLTQRIRSLQPPDVARQAMSELGVLAHELGSLPENLETAGLARSHQQTYFEAIHAYLALAQHAWAAVAEERLEQSGAEPEYRQRAINVARRITQMQKEARTVAANTEFKLPRRTTFLWKRRISLVSNGLRAWQDRLGSPPNNTDMGQGLFLLRGLVGQASTGSLWLGLLDFLIGATVGTLSLLGIGLVARLVAAIIAGSALNITTFAVGILATALVWIFVLLLSVNGPLPLGLLLGAAVFSPTRTTRNIGSGSPVVAVLLKIWWLVLCLLSVPALIVALPLGGLAARAEVAPLAAGGIHQTLLLGGSALALGVAPAVVVCLTLLLLLACPALVVTAIRGAAEMAGNPSWVPEARSYVVQPAQVVVTMLTSGLVIATWIIATGVGLQNLLLVTVPLGTFNADISLRSVALLLALALPFVLLVDLPYRSGMRTWQRSWLADLATRRADVESHIRRLSIIDPRSGLQDTSDDNLRAMQYDLVLLQFYQSKIEEAGRARQTPAAPASLWLALLLAVVVALLLDGGAVLLLRFFPLMGG